MQNNNTYKLGTALKCQISVCTSSQFTGSKLCLVLFHQNIHSLKMKMCSEITFRGNKSFNLPTALTTHYLI